MDPDELRERACRYRKMATRIIDVRAVKALNDLANEYDARAAQVQARAEAESSAAQGHGPATYID
jgi:hypothetical protein